MHWLWFPNIRGVLILSDIQLILSAFFITQQKYECDVYLEIYHQSQNFEKCFYYTIFCDCDTQ